MAAYWRYVAVTCCIVLLISSGSILMTYVLCTWTKLITAFLSLWLLLLAAIAYDVYRLLPCDVTYGGKTLAVLYFVSLASRVTGYMAYFRLMRGTRRVRAAQENLLLSILRSNERTAYGETLRLRGIRSREEFQKRVPLSGYSDVKSYVDRCYQGEKRVMSERDVLYFATSSGTSTGKRNLLPVTKSGFMTNMTAVSITTRIIPDEHFPLNNQLRRSIRLHHGGKLQQSPTGIPVGPMSSGGQGKLVHQLTTFPEPAMLISDRKSSSYVTWLFSLADQSAGNIMAVLASYLYGEFEYLMQVWQDLVPDLEAGRVSPKHVPDPDIRRQLDTSLQPNRKRALDVRREFLQGPKGLARRLWPHCKYVLCIDTGAMAVYGTLLRDSFCEGLPMYSALYPSSEAMIGLNLWPLQRRRQYLPAMDFTHMELIPYEHSHEKNPPTIFLEQAEYGKDYEIVLTTAQGLYRYRNGDVIAVSGFHNECPIFEYRFRIGQLLDVAGEKTPEPILYQSLTLTVAELSDVTLVDYTTTNNALFHQCSSESGATSIGHYVILLELQSADEPVSTEALSEKLDGHLCALSEPYRRCREREVLGPAQVHLVSPGAFYQFGGQRCQDLSPAINQFKMPRYLSHSDSVHFLVDRLI